MDISEDQPTYFLLCTMCEYKYEYGQPRMNQIHVGPRTIRSNLVGDWTVDLSFNLINSNELRVLYQYIAEVSNRKSIAKWLRSSETSIAA